MLLDGLLCFSAIWDVLHQEKDLRIVMFTFVPRRLDLLHSLNTIECPGKELFGVKLKQVCISCIFGIDNHSHCIL